MPAAVPYKRNFNPRSYSRLIAVSGVIATFYY